MQHLYMLPSCLWYFAPELGPFFKYSNVVPMNGHVRALGGSGGSLQTILDAIAECKELMRTSFDATLQVLRQWS